MGKVMVCFQMNFLEWFVHSRSQYLVSCAASSEMKKDYVCVCVVCGYPRKSVFSANGLRFELNECVITGIMILLFELLMLTGLLSLRKCEKKLEKSNGNAIALEKYFKLLCCRFKLLNFTLIISKQYWSMLFVLAISWTILSTFWTAL